MLVNSSLNQINIGLVNGSFSDGDGQHDQRITERTHGRQKKMQGSEKKLWEEFGQENGQIVGLPY